MIFGAVDTNWVGIVTAICGVLTVAITGIVALKQTQLKIVADRASLAADRAAQQADDAARKVHEVAIDLKTTNHTSAKTLERLVDTTDKTLIHVNDQYLVQLRLYKDSMRVIADLRKTTEDEERAVAAEKLYLEHEQKQKEEAAKRS